MAKMGFESDKRLVMDWNNERQTVVMDGVLYKFKSKLEYRYAQLLTLEMNAEKAVGQWDGMPIHKVERWEYETVKLEFPDETAGAKVWTPDFVVSYDSGKTEFHETKGWLTGVDCTKFRRAVKYYPDITIVLVMMQADKKRVNRYRIADKYIERIRYIRAELRQAGMI